MDWEETFNLFKIKLNTYLKSKIQKPDLRNADHNETFECVCVFVCVFMPLQGDRLHQAAAKTVPQAGLLLPGFLHPLLPQDAL